MINLGRFGISTLGPALLAGFTVLGMIHIRPCTGGGSSGFRP